MAETFLTTESYYPQPAVIVPDPTREKPEIENHLRTPYQNYIDINRIRVKSAPDVKPYQNKEIGDILSTLFEIDKKVITKGNEVGFLHQPKSLAKIRRSNELLAMQKEKELEEKLKKYSESDDE